MLSPDQLNQLNSAWQANSPAQSAAPVRTVGDYLQQSKSSQFSNPISDFTTNTGNDIAGRFLNVVKALQEPKQGTGIGSTLKQAGSIGLYGAGQFGGAVSDTVGNALSPLAKLDPGLGSATQAAGQSIANNLSDNAKSHLAHQQQGIADTINKYTSWAQQHPQAAQAFNGLFNIGQGAVATEGIDQGANIAENATDAASMIKDHLAENPISDIPGNLRDKVITPERQAASVDKLEADYSKWKAQLKPGVQELARIDDRTEAFNRSGVKATDPQRILAEAKIIPDVEGTKFRTADQATQFRDSTRYLNETNKAALKEVDYQTPPLSVDELEQRALKNVDTVKMPEGSRLALKQEISAESENLRTKYPGGMKPTDLAEEKSAYQGDVKFDSNAPFRRSAYYQLGHSAQTFIEDAATKAGYPELAQLNRDIGDRLQAADYLQSLDGQTIKGGRLSKYVLGAVGSSLGQSIFGKALGFMGGNFVADYLMKLDISNPIERSVLKTVAEKSPESYQAAVNFIVDQSQQRATRLALPEGSTQYTGEYKGVQDKIMSQEEARDYLKSLGVKGTGPVTKVVPENINPNPETVPVKGSLNLRDQSKTGQEVNLRKPHEPRPKITKVRVEPQ